MERGKIRGVRGPWRGSHISTPTLIPQKEDMSAVLHKEASLVHFGNGIL